MGKRGPRPIPLAIKKMHGSQRGYYKVPDPIGDSQLSACPDWLSAKAKEKWFEVIQKLRRISENLLSSIDDQMLGRYCVIWELWDKARRFIEKNGEVMDVRDKQGRTKNIKLVPQARLSLRYTEELRRIESEFGMTPSARTKVGGGLKGNKSESSKSRFFRFSDFKEQ